MIQIIFLIRSLERGGAERQLIELVSGLDKTRFAVTVVTFYDGGALRPELEALEDVKVVSLRKSGRWDLFFFLWRLFRVVLEEEPMIVHGYMGIANELGLLAGRLAGARVVWGLRASNVNLSCYDWLAAWSFEFGAWLSPLADLIIVNSQAGKQHHITSGYATKHMVVIPNGIDTERFIPDGEARQRMRRQWEVAENQRLIGLVGRLDPMKDHPTFLRAAALLAQKRNDVRFVCVGSGAAAYTRALRALAEKLNLGTCLIWAGATNDMSAVYNALDIATSSSCFGEGFANVIGEAMACGIPCVVTDVGDSAIIVGNAEQVVPPKNPEALLVAWRKLLDMPCEQRTALGKASRERIVREYNVQQLVNRTQSTLISLL